MTVDSYGGRLVGKRIASLAGWLPAVGLAAVVQAAEEPDDVRVVKLTEVSAFEVERYSPLTRGQGGTCDLEPSEKVKAYPSCKSAQPLYGEIDFGPAAGGLRLYVIDESGGTGSGHDRLIIDLNQDLDLTNDSPLGPHPEPPEEERASQSVVESVSYECIQVSCNFGAAGSRLVEVLPRLAIRSYEGVLYRSVTFTGTKAFAGRLAIGGENYKFHLGHSRRAASPFDGPRTTLLVSPEGSRGGSPSWWGGDELRAMHWLDGTLYRFSATSLGDELTVSRYQGDLGTLELSAGDRKLEEYGFRGSIDSPDVAVAVGALDVGGWSSPAKSCRLPVGSYRPNYLTVDYGRLQIDISFNYHADGQPMGYSGQPAIYGIHIRENQPFVFDFSTPPEVMFASPARDHRFKRGEEIEVLAVLTDPKLGFMIRGLDDTKQTKTEEIKLPNGETHSYNRKVSLDPKVFITRAGGERIVEGTLPFG